eukprot:5198718-Pyramimonas_sp.AAC.1
MQYAAKGVQNSASDRRSPSTATFWNPGARLLPVSQACVARERGGCGEGKARLGRPFQRGAARSGV